MQSELSLFALSGLRDCHGHMTRSRNPARVGLFRLCCWERLFNLHPTSLSLIKSRSEDYCGPQFWQTVKEKACVEKKGVVMRDAITLWQTLRWFTAPGGFRTLWADSLLRSLIMLYLRPNDSLRNNHILPIKRRGGRTIQLITKRQCFWNPMTKFSVILTCQETITRKTIRRFMALFFCISVLLMVVLLFNFSLFGPVVILIFTKPKKS